MVSFLKWNSENESEKKRTSNVSMLTISRLWNTIHTNCIGCANIDFLLKQTIRQSRTTHRKGASDLDWPDKNLHRSAESLTNFIGNIIRPINRLSSKKTWANMDYVDITLIHWKKIVIFHRKNNWIFFKKFARNLVKLREKTKYLKQFTFLTIDDANNWFTLALFIDSRCFLLTVGAEHFFPYKIFSNIHLKTKNPFW